jgi:hypothetical protein
MTRRFPTAKKLVIGAVALGTVTLGTAGVAGADTATATTAHPPHHINCARASKALARIQATESHIASGLPKLRAAAAKAQQKGKTTRVDRIKKRISRLENPAYKARLEQRKAKIEAACHASAPSASSTSTSATA